MSKRSLAVDAALIVLVTFAAYLPALRGGFVWDDNLLVTANPMIRASDGLHRFWLTTEAMDYWPLTSTVWWLEWRLWDGNATGYHVVNVLLHATNAVLVWMILRHMKVPGAWLAAVVFAIHPVNVATVAWISELKNTLSMLFFALAVLLYLRFDDEGSARPAVAPYQRLPKDGPEVGLDRRASRGLTRWIWYAFSLTAFLLALLSKTSVVMLPVVLLGCVWWRRGAVRRVDVLRSVPFFVLSLAFGLVTVWFHHYRALGGRQIPIAGFPSRLAAAGWAPWFYLYKALVPFNLTAVYPKWSIDATRFVGWLPGAILVGCFALLWWKRRAWGRPLLFGLGYFVVMLLPILGFLPQGLQRLSPVADHWQYYSIIGVIALAAAGAETISQRLGIRNQITGVLDPLRAGLAVGAVLALLGLATWSRSCVYADNQALWQDNLAKNPSSWAAHTGLGAASMRAGRLPEAIAYYEQALRISPEFAESHSNLGMVLMRANRNREAISYFEEALQISPDYGGAHYNLAMALAQTGRLEESIPHFERVLRANPGFAEAHYNLGLALAQTSRVQEAIPHFEEALRLRPNFAEARCSLAVAFEDEGKIGEAIAQYEQALRINPRLTDVQTRLQRLRAGR